MKKILKIITRINYKGNVINNKIIALFFLNKSRLLKNIIINNIKKNNN